jgi:starvation-inducible DNA-binding protein
MHKTRNDIPEATRRATTELLGVALATAIDLALQAKQAHWNVKGPNFIALHELFDAIAGVAHAKADALAERMAALGGTPKGTIAAVASQSRLAAYPVTITAGNAHLSALADALAVFAKLAREGIDSCGEAVTGDLLTQIAGDIDQQLWFVEAHLQSAA